MGKRLVKTPKAYFADAGTLCSLAGLKDARHAMSGPMGGAIFETAVIGEMARRREIVGDTGSLDAEEHHLPIIVAVLQKDSGRN